MGEREMVDSRLAAADESGARLASRQDHVQIRPQAFDDAGNLGLHPDGDRDQQCDGQRADGDPEDGQGRAQFVRRHRLQRDVS